jgi:uncharacterized protein YwlG (UPF0340 family)
MSNQSNSAVATMGIDIGKNYQFGGVATVNVVLRRTEIVTPLRAMVTLVSSRPTLIGAG